MSILLTASSSITVPLLRAEMGIPDVSAFLVTHRLERKLQSMSRQELEDLQGDLMEIGEPNLVCDLKAALHDTRMPSPLELETQLVTCDFGLVELTCAFLPGRECQFVSARIEASIGASAKTDILRFYDLYPQIFEEPRGDRTVQLGADFRFREVPEYTLGDPLVQINRLMLEPCIYAAGLRTNRAVWDIVARKGGLRGLRSLYLVVQKPTTLTSLTWRFRLVAELKTRWGVLPVSVQRVLQGQETFNMDWPRLLHKSERHRTIKKQPHEVHSMKNGVTPQFLSDLRRGIVESFNVNELRNLCADLGVEYESLDGEGLESKVRELISYLNRRGQLPELVAYCVTARPNYAWPQGSGGRSVPQVTANTRMSARITILFLASDPTDLCRLRLGEELREIQEKLQLAKLRDYFDLQQRLSVRPVDISQALLDVQPQIVHFSGHGTSTGALCFENQIGETHPIQPDVIAALFEQFANQVSCVILNACYSEVQAKAIANHIGHVIGMNQAIGDKAAIAFAIGFYQALGAGRTIEDAYKLGCVQIRLQGIPEHLTPVLIKKGQIQS